MKQTVITAILLTFLLHKRRFFSSPVYLRVL